jgi:hypothetical protein
MRQIFAKTAQFCCARKIIFFALMDRSAAGSSRTRATDAPSRACQEGGYDNDNQRINRQVSRDIPKAPSHLIIQRHMESGVKTAS